MTGSPPAGKAPAEQVAPPSGTPAVSRHDVARGAGIAALARLGALVELVAQPVYTWLYGLTGYGLYAVLLALVSFALNIVNISMENALQRLLPAAQGPQEQAAIVRFALLLVIALSLPVALLASLYADAIAALLSVAPEQESRLPFAIALFAWALPLWALVETATGAVRAMRAFGPEIRLRLFWEQIARLLFAGGLFAIGFAQTGLLLAHLASLGLTACLALAMVGRHFGWRAILFAPLPRGLSPRILVTGLALMPTTLGRRALNDAPTIALNLMIPGAGGAVAAGLFTIGRKLASVPLMIRQAFLYVLAPLSAQQAADDRRHIAPLYGFAMHVSLLLSGMLALALALLAPDILDLFAHGAQDALPLVLTLLAARLVEAVFGPATPIVEMTGHPVLPLVNSGAAVLAMAALALWLVPGMREAGGASGGATAMALAAATGIVIVTLAAVAELALFQKVAPFQPGFARAFLALCAVALAIAALFTLAGAIHAALRVPVMLALFLPGCWMALYLGLSAHDKGALGGLGRRLRLVPPESKCR